MDRKLIRERELFMQRAMAIPTVEKKRHAPSAAGPPAKEPRPAAAKAPVSGISTYSSTTSHFKFSILAKIVNHMRVRHQRRENFALSLEEILEETKQEDIAPRISTWLSAEALPNNLKIAMDSEGKFLYKPTHDLPDRHALKALLQKHCQLGIGGILMSEIEESLPDAQKAIKKLGDKVVRVTRPDKNIVVFYNDPEAQFKVDEEIQQLWRSVSVEGMDERRVTEYLKKQGISSMKQIAVPKVVPVKKRRAVKRRNQNAKRLNDHLTGVLEDYREPDAS